MANTDAKTVFDGSGENNGPESGGLMSRDLSDEQIAGYDVGAKIGQGAMGAVYKATQLSLGRTVAFKVLDSKFVRDPIYLERFEREAQSAAKLHHYNIVQVFDFGEHKGVYFIASEFVDGTNVKQLVISQGALDVSQATDIILQACRGLSAAEKHGIIHRDIKPDNLMLTKDGTVKIADFGLAKAIKQDAGVTQAGVIVGTPFYMSPEQAQGLDLDIRSDIYSLGVTFYHLVTGQIPFDGESVIGVLLKQISAERPDPVAINPNCPLVLGQVIMRMMSRERKKRYNTTAELIQVLEHVGDQLKGGVAGAPLKIPTVPTDRFKRYKLLPGNQILRMREREAPPRVFNELKSMLQADSGVFIQTEEPYSVDTLLEVMFHVPGRDMMYRAFGIVRWISEDADRPGIGVTFVKVSPVPKRVRTPPTAKQVPHTAVHKTPEKAQPTMSPEHLMMRLTETALHQRLLRYYYANANQFVTLRQVANALGVGTRMIDPILEVYEQAGLIQRYSGGEISFVWPDDEAMQEQLVVWIEEYGLHS